jgi:hypothetical protein
LADSLIEGWFGSLRRRVRHEIKTHARENAAIRHSRYSYLQRVLRWAIGGRSLQSFLATYLVIDALFVAAEVTVNTHFPSCLPGWTSPELKSILKDIGSYFIAAQVGILGIVSVAIGIVTLIAQRDDRSSTNTDVRLYYMESLAYEVVLSGVALLIILTTQLMWPVQFAIHRLHLGGPDLIFKVGLTAFHLIWLLLNLCVFTQFVLTTLRFVEPKARERLRERYTANVIVPRDLSLRLSRTLYLMAAKQLIPKTDAKTEPSITLGYGLMDDGEVEISNLFTHRSALEDVWLRPLRFVLRRWAERSERGRTEPPNLRNSLLGTDIRLAITLSFDSRMEGLTEWCLRRRGVPLQRWEKYVIRQCFRFRRVGNDEDDLPTPGMFLEELADKIIGQVDRSAITGFKGAMDELIRYHRFLLDVQDTRTDDGTPINLAEVGGFFEAPYQEWIRQYRRVFERACGKIGAEPYFIQALSHIIIRLLPPNAVGVSAAVVVSLLDLGIHEVIFLEAWVTRRTTVDVQSGESAQPRLELAGSDRRAYDQVVADFVGAWENVLRISDSLYDSKAKQRRPASEQWNALGKSWPFLQRHLRNTAYFLASAVWNEDRIGADRYRDSLLRWIDTLRLGADADFQVKYRLLLTPDLISTNWEQVETRLVPYLTAPWPQPPGPHALFGVLMRAAVDDVINIVAVVTLAWFLNDQQSTDIGAETAALLLRRQVIEGEGSRFTVSSTSQQTAFRSLASLIVRAALTDQLANQKYGASLDELVRFLNGMTERRVVPGRVYSSWGWNGLDSVRPHLLTLLAAHLPAQGDDGLVAWIREIAANENLFAEWDTQLRRITLSLDAYIRALDDGSNERLFERGIRVFVPTADVARARHRLRAIFSEAVAAIQDERTKRLRQRPVDPANLAALRDLLTSSLSPDVRCFVGFHIRKRQAQVTDVTQFRVTSIDKGDLVTPPMSWGNLKDLNKVIVESFREGLAQHVWAQFSQRQRDLVHVDSSDYPSAYFDAVASHVGRVGSRPTLLVPYNRIGNTVSHWSYGLTTDKPEHLQFKRLKGRESGGGIGYLGTVNGTDIFTTPGDEDRSYLFSALMLRSVTYNRVTPSAYVDVIFEEGEDPWRGAIVIRFSQSLKWSDDPVVELVLDDPDEDTDEASPRPIQRQ